MKISAPPKSFPFCVLFFISISLRMAGGRSYLGVSAPLSTAESSEKDKRLLQDLEATLKQNGMYETSEITLKRYNISFSDDGTLQHVE